MHSLLLREGIAITPRQYHTLQVCGSSTIRHRQCYHTPFHHSPHYHTPYALPWVLQSNPVVHHTLFVAPASLILSPGLHTIPHTPQDTTPSDILFETEISVVVWFLMWYTPYQSDTTIIEHQKHVWMAL